MLRATKVKRGVNPLRLQGPSDLPGTDGVGTRMGYDPSEVRTSERVRESVLRRGR